MRSFGTKLSEIRIKIRIKLFINLTFSSTKLIWKFCRQNLDHLLHLNVLSNDYGNEVNWCILVNTGSSKKNTNHWINANPCDISDVFTWVQFYSVVNDQATTLYDKFQSYTLQNYFHISQRPLSSLLSFCFLSDDQLLILSTISYNLAAWSLFKQRGLQFRVGW